MSRPQFVTESDNRMLSDAQRDKVKDITRLICPEQDRRAFLDILEHELRGREELPDSELRHIAERIWREFLRQGWGPKSYSPEDMA